MSPALVGLGDTTSLLRGIGGVMRVVVVAAAISLSILGLSLADDAKASIRRPTNIPAEALVPALKQLAHDRGIQVVFQTEVVGATQTHGAVGELTTAEALTQLLEGTNLVYRYLDEKTITIARMSDSSSSAGSAPTPADTTPPASTLGDAKKEGKRSSSEGFRVAQMDQGAPASSPTSVRKSEKAADYKPVQLEEVIVTAEKRNERLQDVPVPVTAISAQALVDSNQLRLQDYYASVPGLSMTSQGQGNTILTIRGLTTGGQGVSNPTVGITVDDVPFGATNYFAASYAGVPDIDPSDLKQVEVLRGPQGTLYGSSSIGGLLKFVTIDPSTEGMSGRVQGDINSVHNGDGAGYGLRAAINLPLGDAFAVRASGFTRRDPGYIDDPALHINGVNQTDVHGGRLSALWRPSPKLSIKLSALLQSTKANGSSDITPPGLGDLQHLHLRGTGGYRRDASVYSATVVGSMGDVSLTSISSYGIDKYTGIADATPYFSSYADQLYGVTGAESYSRNTTKKFTQEIRISNSSSKRLDWLLGVFYTHEDNNQPGGGLSLAINPADGAVAGTLANFAFPTIYAEYAAFGDLTLHITDRFDVQFGAREGQNKQRYEETDTGPLMPIFFGVPFVYNPPLHTKDNSFTYLLTPSFKLSPNFMAYARLASGYRPGGPNSTCLVFTVPCTYAPDKTLNYEIGAKGQALDGVLSFDASVYYIDWKDIQLMVLEPTSGFAFFTNGGGAKSQGLELSVQTKPLKGLTIAAWVSWSDAVLKTDLPSNSLSVGLSGDRLPYSSRFSANASAEEEFSIAPDVTGFVGSSVSYIGERIGDFASSFSPGPRTVFPSYTKIDLRAGVRYGLWTLNCFANNLADRRGVLDIVPLGATVSTAYIQPRTVGLSLSERF